jgi:translocation and assembly module TamB
VLGNLREFAGLDVLTFGTEASSLTVTGGKYVGNNLYLEVVGGGRGGTSVQADWRVLKNLSIVSQLAGQGYSRVSIYWRKDFH